mmetsp:Transcript_2956/g.12074  ORF Transcript_2956/g.12074 Transcript_2956/m.12074 type:complete len:272 (+) Transcript_2956:416-1231(+)
MCRAARQRTHARRRNRSRKPCTDRGGSLRGRATSSSVSPYRQPSASVTGIATAAPPSGSAEPLRSAACPKSWATCHWPSQYHSSPGRATSSVPPGSGVPSGDAHSAVSPSSSWAGFQPEEDANAWRWKTTSQRCDGACSPAEPSVEPPGEAAAVAAERPRPPSLAAGSEAASPLEGDEAVAAEGGPAVACGDAAVSAASAWAADISASRSCSLRDSLSSSVRWNVALSSSSSRRRDDSVAAAASAAAVAAAVASAVAAAAAAAAASSTAVC